MEKLMRVLRFLRITDAKDNLSLTQLALMIALANLLHRPEVGTNDAIGLVITIIGYQAKRFAKTEHSPTEIDQIKRAVETLATKVTAIHMTRSKR